MKLFGFSFLPVPGGRSYMPEVPYIPEVPAIERGDMLNFKDFLETINRFDLNGLLN